MISTWRKEDTVILSGSCRPSSRRWQYWLGLCGCNRYVLPFEARRGHLVYELILYASTKSLPQGVDRTKVWQSCCGCSSHNLMIRVRLNSKWSGCLTYISFTLWLTGRSRIDGNEPHIISPILIQWLWYPSTSRYWMLHVSIPLGQHLQMNVNVYRRGVRFFAQVGAWDLIGSPRSAASKHA